MARYTQPGPPSSAKVTRESSPPGAETPAWPRPGWRHLARLRLTISSGVGQWNPTLRKVREAWGTRLKTDDRRL